jgi:hypothetical protein
MPRRVNSTLKPHRRRTDDKLDLDDLIAAPNLGGMLSFLDVPPDEARRRHQLRRAVEEQHAAMTVDPEGPSTVEGRSTPEGVSAIEVHTPTGADSAIGGDRAAHGSPHVVERPTGGHPPTGGAQPTASVRTTPGVRPPVVGSSSLPQPTTVAEEQVDDDMAREGPPHSLPHPPSGAHMGQEDEGCRIRFP